MTRRDLFVGFDVGTTSVKGGVFDCSGRLLCSFGETYPKSCPRPGWVEQDPYDWVRLIKRGLGRFSERVELSRVGAMCVCSQVNTHVFVEESGAPVAPAVVWQDTRASEIARELDASFSSAERRAIWGGEFVVDASFALSRAVWLAKYEPRLWERTRWILSPKDFCKFVLTGALSSDPISSVGLTSATGQYVQGLESRLEGFNARLPPLRQIMEPQGPVRTSELAEFSPIVVNGTMDAWANLFGSGVLEHGQGMLVAGTSSIVGVLSNGARPVRGVITFAPFRDKILHAGPTQAGADALAWFAGISGKTISALLSEIAGKKARTTPLLFLPHLQGERAPLWDSAARGVFVGLTQRHDLTDMGRAILEGVAYSERHLLEEVRKAAGCRPDALRLSGGSSRVDMWSQIRSDVLGVRLERAVVRDTGMVGAAVIGAVGAGLFPGVEAAVETLVGFDTVFEPDDEKASYYDQLYANYKGSYKGLRDVFRSISGLEPI